MQNQLTQKKKEYLLNNALSNKNVLETYQKSCQFVQDWTLSVDYGPFK